MHDLSIRKLKVMHSRVTLCYEQYRKWSIKRRGAYLIIPAMRHLYESGLSEVCIRYARFNIKYTSNSWLKVLGLVFQTHFPVFGYRKNTSSCVWYNFSVYRYQMKHSFWCLIYHFSLFGYQTETLLFVFDISLLGVWISDETLPRVFDILLLGAWKSEKNTSSRV